MTGGKGGKSEHIMGDVSQHGILVVLYMKCSMLAIYMSTPLPIVVYM